MPLPRRLLRIMPCRPEGIEHPGKRVSTRICMRRSLSIQTLGHLHLHAARFRSTVLTTDASAGQQKLPGRHVHHVNIIAARFEKIDSSRPRKATVKRIHAMPMRSTIVSAPPPSSGSVVLSMNHIPARQRLGLAAVGNSFQAQQHRTVPGLWRVRLRKPSLPRPRSPRPAGGPPAKTSMDAA